AVRAALAGCRRDPAARQVLVAHQFVTAAGQAPGLSGSESVMVGGLDNVDAAAFEGFNYVALGHIHRRQPVGSLAWYSGTPMAYSLDEAGQEKGCLVVELDAAGHAEVRFAPFAPLHPIRHVTGPLAELIAEAALSPEGREDYIYASLTDPTPVTDAMARLQAVWPNAMKLDYPSTAAAADLRTAAAEVENKSFQELFFDFYRQMNGQDPSEEAWQIIRRLTREGGIEP
ncbi:MAG: exonuclease SbcCD subunit D C-terminal domain-containing protein, partial [Oscillospiraceae bacterium]|nr:exonuclease SbcCD subunit D C-terminal domain-containing protein [Oscillospiraceae bacterium]